MDDQLPAEERAQHSERVAVFKRLGFTETEADLLAASDATADEASAMLGNGCSHALAVRILH